MPTAAACRISSNSGRGERRYRLIEVKGPGDRLQDNQIRWLSFCVAQEIPVCVCKVNGRRCIVTYTVSVRALCEFTAKAGDLDRRFTPSPSAQEGMEGHATIAARRRAGYEKRDHARE